MSNDKPPQGSHPATEQLPPEGGCITPPATEAEIKAAKEAQDKQAEIEKAEAEKAAAANKPPKPPSTPLLECFHNTVGCKAVALHAKDATEKGWYEDTLKIWYCQDHGQLKRVADEHNRKVVR